MHRYCDLVEIANRSNLINSFCSGIIQVDNHRLYKTPTYYAQQLYATLAGNRPLRIEAAPSPGLDLSATLTADGSYLVVFVVNQSLTSQLRTLDFTALISKPSSLALWTLGMGNMRENLQRATRSTTLKGCQCANLLCAFGAGPSNTISNRFPSRLSDARCTERETIGSATKNQVSSEAPWDGGLRFALPVTIFSPRVQDGVDHDSVPDHPKDNTVREPTRVNPANLLATMPNA